MFSDKQAKVLEKLHLIFGEELNQRVRILGSTVDAKVILANGVEAILYIDVAGKVEMQISKQTAGGTVTFTGDMKLVEKS